MKKEGGRYTVGVDKQTTDSSDEVEAKVKVMMEAESAIGVGAGGEVLTD